jgi:glycosyltransferase involved in cell wall biosynthesis
MKIWLLTTEFPPGFGGGIATYSAITANLLIEHGHEVTVFVVDEAQESMHITDKGHVRIVRFQNTSSPSLTALGYGPLLSYHYAHWVEFMIRRDGPPDIIESQDYSGIAAHLLQRKRTLDPVFQRIPIIVTSHSPKFLLDSIDQAPVYQFPGYWIGEMERFSLKAADGVISPSHYLREALLREMGEINPEVIPNPYDLPDLIPHTGNSRLLYVGRLQYLKGILVLLETLSTLWDEGFPLGLDVVGGDNTFYPRRTMMRTYIEQRYHRYIASGQLCLRGPLPPQTVAAAYAQAYAVIVPSYFENFPYVALEAMAQETVVLASNTGGQKEIIEHGGNGFLFSHDTLAATLNSLAVLDRQSRLDIGRRARQEVRRYANPETVYERKMGYFEEVRRARKDSHRFPFVRPAGQTPIITPAHNNTVSVVVPYFNRGTILFDTLDSLAAIQDPALEILVVDDGSTDGMSIAALHQAMQRYPQIRVLRKAQGGLASARNFGAERASGTYLAFLDADDKVDPRYYPRALKIFEYYSNVSFVGAWVQYFGESNALRPTWNPEPPYALYQNPVNSSSLVYRTEHFMEYGLNDPTMEYGMEDYESMVRMLSRGCQGVVIPEPYFLYRIRADSMFRGFNPNNLNLLYQWVMDKNPGIYAQYQRELLLLLNANGPQYLVDNPGWPSHVSESRSSAFGRHL